MTTARAVLARFRPVFTGDGLAAIITRRLVAVIVLFAVLDLGFVVFSYLGDREGLAQHLVTLQAEEIGEAITIHDGKARFEPDLLYREPIGAARMAFAVYDRQGKELVLDGPWELAHALTPPITSVHSETRRDDVANGFFLHGVRRVMADGEPFWVVVVVRGAGLRPFWPVVANEMMQHVGVPLLPLILLLLALNATVVHRALSPLSAAAREVEALDPSRPDGRLTTPASPRELRGLVSAMNQALERIEAAMRAMRDFTSDAAHELRTPLAILSMEVDELPPGQARDKLREDVAHMTRTVGQMLDMASADALIQSSGTAVGLNEVCTRVVAQLTPLAIRRRHTILFVDDHAASVAGHPEAIGRAVRNLIENALVHTPEDTSIEVTAGPGAVISVRDHGPGIPPEKREMVLKRFWRGDRSRSEGSGLGLAIVQRVAEAHGGRVEIGDAEGGGALIRLRLDGNRVPAA